jgi:hypothetical protein
MIPNRVFLEEIKHLIPVPELSEPAVPTTAIVRKTNVVHYKRNRYEVPKGTYSPGKQARIEVENDMVKFFDIKTGEMFSEHEISCGFGNLVSLPHNAERFQNSKWEELKVEVLSGFSGCEGGETFVCKIVEKYPRYIRDQLGIIKKQQEKFSKSKLSAALKYCTN